MGIQLHSTVPTWEPYVIFAIDAASNGRTPQQTILGVTQFKLWCAERGLGVKELIGSYKGTTEPAFIMRASDFEANGLHVTWCTGQESILALSGKQEPHKANAGFRLAALVFTDTSKPMVQLGRWECVSGDDARSLDAWTYDPTDGLFWAARGEAA